MTVMISRLALNISSLFNIDSLVYLIDLKSAIIFSLKLWQMSRPQTVCKVSISCILKNLPIALVCLALLAMSVSVTRINREPTPDGNQTTTEVLRSCPFSQALQTCSSDYSSPPFPGIQSIPSAAAKKLLFSEVLTRAKPKLVLNESYD